MVDGPVPVPVDPQDFHWALHAVVSACPRERYDQMAPLQALPKAPPMKALAERPRSRGRRTEPETVPVFGPLKKK
jgi:hypothetical protein